MTRITIILAILNCVGATNFVQNKIGLLYLSNNKWEIQYVLNLTEYKNTVETLHECVNILTTICEKGQNPLCPYFLQETKNIKFELQADISKLNVLNRQKRFIFFVPIILGVAFVSFWAGMHTARMNVDIVRENLQQNLNIMEQASNITISALSLQEKYIKDADTRFENIEKSINSIQFKFKHTRNFLAQ